MPVYRLVPDLLFPPVSHADPSGLLAVGGDLSPERLLLAYSSGIFPWFNEEDPILWWSPEPRFILEPQELKVSRSLEKVIRQGRFEVTINRDFKEVIACCAELREAEGKGTWITPEMRRAYLSLHAMGFAHSVECRQEGRLVGGLYGVALGRCFFGESMFHKVSDASKVAFVSLARGLARRGFELIDCQMPTRHLKSLGAKGIRRHDFLERLVRGGVAPSPDQRPVDLADLLAT